MFEYKIIKIIKFENEKVKNYIELCQKHYISTGMHFKANTNISDLWIVICEF